MLNYKLSEEGRTVLKRTWMLSVLISYGGIIGVFGFNLLYRGGDTRSIIIFGTIVCAMAVAFYYGRKKYFRNTDDTQLAISTDRVTLRVLNQPDVAIEFANIRHIKHTKQGIYLINKYPSKKSLFIMNKFEGFEEIEKLVTNRLSKREAPAIN